ncbi:MAG: mycofactocin system glycosyltransferase, partial [Nocardioides sp.]|nr:mycofactocin system glycosyltransferase [Nocardioides sp.]
GLVAWAVAHRRLADTLPAASAGRVAASALGSSVRQEASLAVRHLWPLAALAATTRTGRRVLLAAAVVDGAVALTDRRGLDPLTRLAGRRIDDLAYGAGVWWGCARAGSARALLPRLSPAQPRSRSAPA